MDKALRIRPHPTYSSPQRTGALSESIDHPGRPRRLVLLRTLIVVCLLGGAITGCGGVSLRQRVPLAPLALTTTDQPAEYQLLAAGDVLAVSYPYRPDFDRDVVVRMDGRITLPYIGPVVAAGETPEAVERAIRADYAELAYSPSELVPDRHYLLNVGDELEIKFRGDTTLNSTVKVRPDGRITLQLVRSVMAEGKSPEALARELTALYRSRTGLTNPDLVVIVKNFTSNRVYVDGQLVRPGVKDLDDPTVIVKAMVPRQVYVAGEVRAPGFLAFRPSLTALQAIIAAGGTPRSAKMDKVLVLRRGPNDSTAAIFLNLEDDMAGRRINDVQLRPFDIVIVPKTGIARLNDFLDQYLYQLIPATRNVNFSFFYDLRNRGTVVP